MRNTDTLLSYYLLIAWLAFFICMFRVNTQLSSRNFDSGLLSCRNTDNLCIFSLWHGCGFWAFCYNSTLQEEWNCVLGLWTADTCGHLKTAFFIDGTCFNSVVLSGILTYLLLITFSSDWQFVFLLWMQNCLAVIELWKALNTKFCWSSVGHCVPWMYLLCGWLQQQMV